MAVIIFVGKIAHVLVCSCCRVLVVLGTFIFILKQQSLLTHLFFDFLFSYNSCVFALPPPYTKPLFLRHTQSQLHERNQKNSTTMDGQKDGFNEILIEPLRQFAKDSIHLVKKCTKPDRKEFTQIARATLVGFAIMGFIGFFVKLVHIPINNILVGN
mmetsp:Transcript_1065/g.1140  ORF Transcript_1065/g.1140 Transcript_1065/m.1140 type:complete len:157 (-) Transcript_1065:111-581(-)